MLRISNGREDLFAVVHLNRCDASWRTEKNPSLAAFMGPDSLASLVLHLLDEMGRMRRSGS